MEKLLLKQVEFKRKGIDSTIDVGYHYTSTGSMDSIHNNGLLQRPDTEGTDVRPKAIHGEVFGPGVYTGARPRTFRKFGPTGIIVATLLGKQIRIKEKRRDTDEVGNANTIIGDKLVKHHQAWISCGRNHEVILKSSDQAVPIFEYQTTA